MATYKPSFESSFQEWRAHYYPSFSSGRPDPYRSTTKAHRLGFGFSPEPGRSPKCSFCFDMSDSPGIVILLVVFSLPLTDTHRRKERGIRSQGEKEGKRKKTNTQLPRPQQQPLPTRRACFLGSRLPSKIIRLVPVVHPRSLEFWAIGGRNGPGLGPSSPPLSSPSSGKVHSAQPGQCSHHASWL